MAAQLNIAALSRRTGVAPDTIRKWEQRYGILRPARTPGGQRRYTEVDVERIEWLLARLAEGYRISEAATLLGTHAQESPPSAGRLLDALADAVAVSDARRIARLVDQAFALLELEKALERVIAPALQRTGDAWQAGEVGVGQEHLLSAAVRSRLERLLADGRAGVRGRAVLACAPGERHELGLLMLALLLRRDGWEVAYLGADTPFGDTAAVACDLEAQVVCVSVTMPQHARRLRALPGEAQLLVGGAGATEELAARLGARWARGSLPRAVHSLRRLAA